MSEKLKPCPFCGGEAVRMELMDYVTPRLGCWTRHIGCLKCGVIANFSIATDCDVAKVWNARAHAFSVPPTPKDSSNVEA